jgi:hypothetical protein
MKHLQCLSFIALIIISQSLVAMEPRQMTRAEKLAKIKADAEKRKAAAASVSSDPWAASKLLHDKAEREKKIQQEKEEADYQLEAQRKMHDIEELKALEKTLLEENEKNVVLSKEEQARRTRLKGKGKAK